jgi:hydroxyacylglutathione hydrolase
MPQSPTPELRVLVQPVLVSNYQFVVNPAGAALAVDPADDEVAWDAIARAGGRLAAILITHHHPDHIAGVPGLLRRIDCPVIGPVEPLLPFITRPVGEGDQLELGGLALDVWATPGHTASHIAFLAAGCGVLFSGDVLFPGGCGRRAPAVSAATFHATLQRLAALPDETRVHAGHEYAEENLRFALSVAPDDAAVQAQARRVAEQRQAGQPTIPFGMGDERRSNLFLRAPDAAAFDALRRRKDVFA